MRGELGLDNWEPDRYLKYNKPEQKLWFPTSYSRLAPPLVFPLSVTHCLDQNVGILIPTPSLSPSISPLSTAPNTLGTPSCLHFRCFQPGVSTILPHLDHCGAALLAPYFPAFFTGRGMSRVISLPLLKHSSPSHTEDKSRTSPTTPVCMILSCFQAVSYPTVP